MPPASHDAEFSAKAVVQSLSLGDFRIVSCLEIDPQIHGCAEVNGQPRRCAARNGAFDVNNVIDPPRRHTDIPGPVDSG